MTFASLMGLGPSARAEGGGPGRRTGLSPVLDGRDHRPRGVLDPGRRRAPPRLDLGLGTGVLALQLRTPMVVAMAGATLQSLHPDSDIVLGVGISSPVVTERWHGVPYGDRPLARTREYVTLLRECLAGESVTFKGDYYECSRFRLGVRLGERRPKIVIGALNPGMLRLAGEVADGVLLNYLPATHVAWSVEQVRAGEAAAGRTAGSTTIYAYVHLGVVRARGRHRPRAARSVLVRRRRRVRRATSSAPASRRTSPPSVSDTRPAIATARSPRSATSSSTPSTSWATPTTCERACRRYVDAGVDVPDPHAVAVGTRPLDGHRRDHARRDRRLTDARSTFTTWSSTDKVASSPAAPTASAERCAGGSSAEGARGVVVVDRDADGVQTARRRAR